MNIIKSLDEIKCEHCGYDGSDLKVGRKPAMMEIGYLRLICIKCKKDTKFKLEVD